MKVLKTTGFVMLGGVIGYVIYVELLSRYLAKEWDNA